MHDQDWWNLLLVRSHRSTDNNLSQPIHVLVIEDNPVDTHLVQAMLSNVQDEIELSVVPQLATALAHLKDNMTDVVLLTLELAGTTGLNAFNELRTSEPHVAVIVVTSSENEAEGIEALQRGAQDYLVKEQLDSRTLQRAIRYAVERHRTEIALRENEERFRAMFEQAAVGMNFTDANGRFQLINQKFCEIVGFSAVELREKTFVDLIHPDDADEDWTNFKRLVDGEQDHYVIEKRCIHKNGSVVWVNKTVTRTQITRKEPLWFLGVIQDISSRKIAELAQQHLAAIVASSDDAIISKTLDGTILSWNAAAEHMYGYRAEEVIGQPVAILFPPGYEEELERIMSRIRQGESVSHLETKRIRKDGKLLDIALTVSPIKNTRGDVIGASAIARDITTLVWLQTVRQESEQRLRQMTENISEVLWLRDIEQGQMLYVSPAYTTVWGLKREQLYERPDSFLEMVHPEDKQRVMEAAERSISGGFDEEYRIVQHDGEERWIHARTFPIRNSAGEIYRIAGIAKDITDYKRLAATEHEQRLLAEAMRDIANALNSTREIHEVLDLLLVHIEQVVPHDAAEIMLVQDGVARVVRSRGYADRGLQSELEALEFPVDETPNLHYMMQTMKPLIISDVLDDNSDMPKFKTSPALFWRSCASVPICSRDEVMGFINLCSLTPYFFTPIHADRLQGFAEQAAIALRNALLLEQARELAAHQERQRLARDLHDAVSQTLFSAAITAEAFVRRWQQDPNSVGPKLADLHRLTRGALAETRAVLLELRPEALTDIGFEELLHQLAEAVQSRKRLDINLQLENANALLPEIKLVLYRITQEALNNIVKHARATRVDIRLLQLDGQVQLDIRDDGQGFNPASIRPTSMGLGFMRERAESIDAKLDIISIPGEGTQVVVIWPNQTRKVIG